MVRFKYRYFAVSVEPNVSSSVPLDAESVVKAIRNKVQELHGDYGIGAMEPGFKVKYTRKQTRIIIVRTQHGPHRFVASAVPLIHTVGNESITCSILYCGATLRQCFLHIMKFHKQELRKLWSSVSSKEGKNQVARAFAELDAKELKDSFNQNL